MRLWITWLICPSSALTSLGRRVWKIHTGSACREGRNPPIPDKVADHRHSFDRGPSPREGKQLCGSGPWRGTWPAPPWPAAMSGVFTGRARPSKHCSEAVSKLFEICCGGCRRFLRFTARLHPLAFDDLPAQLFVGLVKLLGAVLHQVLLPAFRGTSAVPSPPALGNIASDRRVLPLLSGNGRLDKLEIPCPSVLIDQLPSTSACVVSSPPSLTLQASAGPEASVQAVPRIWLCLHPRMSSTALFTIKCCPLAFLKNTMSGMAWIKV